MMRVIVIAIVMCVLHSNRLSTLAQSQIPLQVCVEGDGGSSCANSGSSSEGGSDGLGNEDVDKQQWKDVLLFPDGGIYSGGVANGVQEGEGREESAEGDRYDGEWEGGVKSGAGKYKWKDGRTYKGEFRDNKPNGMGMLKTQDGASYIGMWIDGSKHGQGRYRWASGKVYEGQWENGLQHGHGKLYSPPDPKSGGGHVGTSGVVGELIYEGMFYKGSPVKNR